jgi:predicted LPLAT superfamily acyltransferase
MADTDWGGLKEVGSAWGLTFLYKLYRIFGRWPFRLALAPVLLYFFLFKPGPRRASMQFLRKAHALGGLKEKPDWVTGLKHSYSFAESVLDKLIAVHGGFGLKDVDFEGREAVVERLQRKQGVLFIGAHLGNMDLCRVLSHSRNDMSLQVLVHTRHAENFNRLMRRINPATQVKLHQVTQIGPAEAAWLADRVEQGECLMTAGDRVPPGGGRTVSVDFMGEAAEFAQGPWVLASLLGCPVFLLFCSRVDGRYRLSVEPFAEKVVLERGRREAAVAELVSRYARRLEHHALLSPLQWFNFYGFWDKHEPAKKS